MKLGSELSDLCYPIVHTVHEGVYHLKGDALLGVQSQDGVLVEVPEYVIAEPGWNPVAYSLERKNLKRTCIDLLCAMAFLQEILQFLDEASSNLSGSEKVTNNSRDLCQRPSDND